MDNSSVFKIADRRASHSEEPEEKKPAQPPTGKQETAPAGLPPQPPKTSNQAPADTMPAARPPAAGGSQEPTDEADIPADMPPDDEEPSEPQTPPRRAGQPRAPHGGTRGPSLVSMHIVETAGFMMEILLQKSFITMGLIPNPDTGRRERDLGQTRIAIDLMTATAEQMRGRWGMPGVEQDIEAQLTSLRLQYARMAPAEPDKA
ncbi:MAG TPA: DUF1844 domain-containing protein [Candidatus Ozemobacteraceae bacterium]|nr:DUF1844 domain-containing protein [Candidatus Ozemobacteraceae bacterium]